jgi:hypothetical protein
MIRGRRVQSRKPARVAGRRARLALFSVALGFLLPLAFPATPAYAYTINDDDATADIADRINGVPVLTRVLRPTTGTFPLVVYLAGVGSSRCDDINQPTSWLSRADLAAQGYVVVSVNPRGMPGSAAVTQCAGGTQGTWNSDAADGLDDSGYDLSGPTDLQDISSLITWAINGCNGSCSGAVDPNKIAIIGQNADATRALLMPGFDSRVDAVVPVAFGQPMRNLVNVSSDGAGTPAFRSVDLGYGGGLWDSNQGYFGHADPSVMTNYAETLRQAYLPNNNYTGTITSGSPSLTVTGPPYFSTDDVGRTVSVAGAGGSATTTLWTSIASVTDATHVTLANNATSTVSTTNPRLVSWLPKLGNSSASGGMSSGSAVLSISTTSYPKFTSGDVGQPVTVAGALAGGRTLSTTIAGYTDATHVTLAAPATAAVANAQTRWRQAAWMDQRTVVDDDNAVDKAHLLTSTKVFAVAGYLDGTSGTLPSIELWNRIPSSNVDKYLYLGACGANSAPCGTNNRAWLQAKVLGFLGKYLKAVSGSLNGPIFYLVPAKATGTPPVVPVDNWGPGANGTPQEYAPADNKAWPPSSNSTASTYCMDSDGLWKTYSAGTCSGLVGGTRTISNRDYDTNSADTNYTDPQTAYCLYLAGYSPGYITASPTEAVSYDSGTTGGDAKIAKVEFDMYAHSDTSRLQVYVDLYEVKSDGTEVRIWTGASQNVPTARHQAPGSGNKVHFRFQPSGTNWTLAAGSKLRVKVASNQRNVFAPELIPGTTSLYHSATNKMLLTITWLLS